MNSTQTCNSVTFYFMKNPSSELRRKWVLPNMIRVVQTCSYLVISTSCSHQKMRFSWNKVWWNYKFAWNSWTDHFRAKTPLSNSSCSSHCALKLAQKWCMFATMWNLLYTWAIRLRMARIECYSILNYKFYKKIAIFYIWLTLEPHESNILW